ncbi:MAG: hypothetical protein DHS20C16_08810 [Phycisphaerae bacterium]|nr:MAG: hypothetical protein DHS20C16_08810 [Phycisphaerae bacterium]
MEADPPKETSATDVEAIAANALSGVGDDATADHAANDFDVYCHECGYNLRGISEPRCPECGKDSPALLNAESSIPWIHRKELGNVRAFLKTVLFATFSPRKLSEDVYLHIDYREARKFQRWTIAVAMVWMICTTIMLHVAAARGELTDTTIVSALEMYWPSVLFNALVLLYLMLATGIPSLFFDYRDVPINLRNNAIALSYYCCAPLTWWPLPVIISIQLFKQNPLDIKNLWVSVPLTTIAVITPAAPIILWCFQVYRIAKRVLRGQTGRKAWMTTGIPLLWLLAAILVFGLVPLALFYAWVFIDAVS